MKEKIPSQLLKSKGSSPQNNMSSTLEVLWLFVYIEVTYHPTKILIHRNMYKHMIIISSIVVQTRVFLSCNQKLCHFYKSLLNRYERIWSKLIPYVNTRKRGRLLWKTLRTSYISFHVSQKYYAIIRTSTKSRISFRFHINKKMGRNSASSFLWDRIVALRRLNESYYKFSSMGKNLYSKGPIVRGNCCLPTPEVVVNKKSERGLRTYCNN